MLRAVKLPRDTSEYDLLVIGDGAIGMATAIEHARRNPDARTALIAPLGRSCGASTAAGLMLNAFGELEPGQFENPAGRARFGLARSAVKYWPQWLAELGEIAGVMPPHIREGTVVLAQEGDEAIQAILNALVDEHEPHIAISPTEVPGYSPARGFAADTAVYLPREGAVPAREVIALMDCAAEQLGITRIDGRVQSITPLPRGCSIQLEEEHVLHAQSILIAAGAWSGSLLDSIPELAGRCPNVLFGIGRAYRVEHRDETVRPRTVFRFPNQPSGGGYHLVPFDNNTAYVGASNHCVSQPGHEDDLASFPLGAVADRLRRELRCAKVESVLGYRPISADGIPLLGRTDIEGISVATGTRRDGFTIAPVVAQALVDELLDGDTRFDPAFKPDRCDVPGVVTIA